MITPANATTRAGGFILIMVLVIILLASMVAASLLFMLSAEQTAAAAGASGDQAWAAALSGVYQAMQTAVETEAGSSDWQENPDAFRNHLVCEDGARKWYFSVYSLGGVEGAALRYGLTDETAKMNVNAATAAMLESLPNMTPTLAQAILEPSSGSSRATAVSPDSPDLGPAAEPTRADSNAGAGSNVVMVSAGTRASARPGWLDELLTAPGFSARLLYGEDANQNGRLDVNEDDSDTTFPPDNQDGQLDLGLSQLLTVTSYDLNVDIDGKPRVNLNEPSVDLASLDLSKGVVGYLEAMRRNQQLLRHPADLVEATGKFKDEKGTELELSAEMTKADLAILLDRCTTTNQMRRTGLINLNTASARVLAALPGSNEALSEAIVAARTGLSPEARRTPAWLYEDGLVNADLFKKIVPYLTTRSYQFRFHVAAYCVPAGGFRVLEAIIDTATKPPVIVSLRDLTRLGLPFGSPTPAEMENQARAHGASRAARVVAHDRAPTSATPSPRANELPGGVGRAVLCAPLSRVNPRGAHPLPSRLLPALFIGAPRSATPSPRANELPGGVGRAVLCTPLSRVNPRGAHPQASERLRGVGRAPTRRNTPLSALVAQGGLQ